MASVAISFFSLVLWILSVSSNGLIQNDLASRLRTAPPCSTITTLMAETQRPQEETSSLAAEEEEETKNLASCPFQQTLQQVPAVPILGSFFPPLTGIPKPDRRFPNRFNVQMNAKYGDFYCMVVPTIGKDIAPELYVLTDPNEMKKVVQSSSAIATDPKYQFPVGIVEQQWPIHRYLSLQDSRIANLFTRGPQWWDVRQSIQTALSHPAAQQATVPAAIRASRRFTMHDNDETAAVVTTTTTSSRDLNQQLNRVAFDMFEHVLFGDGENDSHEEESSEELFHATLAGMIEAQALRRSPVQSILKKVGIQTAAARECYSHLDRAVAILRQRVTTCRNSVLLQSLRNDGFPEREIPYACLAMLLGAIDTTAGKMAWNLLQLAAHPHVQTALYDEITSVTTGSTIIGKSNRRVISTSVLDKTLTPYLHGVVRETHRLTPAVTVNLIKDALSPLTIHGQTFPAQTAFLLDTTTPQVSVDAVYDPTRWLPDRVRARKTTAPKTTTTTATVLLDHPYLSQPFGQGPRRCPGAAVALSEVHSFLAQFVLDWEIVAVNHPLDYRDVPSLMNTGPIPDFPASIQIRKRA